MRRDACVDDHGVTTLLAPDGQPYAPTAIDPEGLVLTKDRELILTSEGYANAVPPVDPFVRRGADGLTIKRSTTERKRSSPERVIT